MNGSKAYGELVKIINESYMKSSSFKDEFLQALNRKTGNNNLGSLCKYIIENGKT